MLRLQHSDLYLEYVFYGTSFIVYVNLRIIANNGRKVNLWIMLVCWIRT